MSRWHHVTVMPKRPKTCRNSFSNSSSSHILFPRDFSGTIEDTDVINTPLEPLRPADVSFGFWGFRWYCFPFGGEIPPNSNFWGVSRRFQVKRSLKVSCYLNYCIDFNQIRRNDRDHQVVIVGGPSRRPIKFKMADGRHFEKKPLNHHISATVRSILMEFSTMMHIGPGHRNNR